MKASAGIAVIFVAAMVIGIIPPAPIAFACAVAVLGIVISR